MGSNPETSMRYVLSIPVLAPIILLFNLVNYSKEQFGTWLDTESILVEGIILPSELEFFLTIGNVLVVIALFGLFLKIVRAVLFGPSSVFDRIVSTATFVVAFTEFLFVTACGSASFFVLVVMALVDFGAGFVAQNSPNNRMEQIDGVGP
jgi:hypothetical protein